ncbi:phosphoglucomutase [Halomonas huangheensis]|nr:phosphoglucomutase [Halomonas huangheensis]
MRHGHSQANAMGLIVSSPEHGLLGYGLSAKGEEQLSRRISEWHLSAPQRILHSDFLRTTETAQRIADHFAIPLEPDVRLRERFFGDCDLQPDNCYHDVWEQDAEDPSQQHRDVESVCQVAERLCALIAELEQRYDDTSLLLVSHGDPLQILLTAAARRPLNEHREISPLMPADVRPLITSQGH